MFGIIVGVTLSYFFTILKTCPVSNEVDVESLKIASHNIVNTCKELTDGKDKQNVLKGPRSIVIDSHHLHHNSYF